MLAISRALISASEEATAHFLLVDGMIDAPAISGRSCQRQHPSQLSWGLSASEASTCPGARAPRGTPWLPAARPRQPPPRQDPARETWKLEISELPNSSPSKAYLALPAHLLSLPANVLYTALALLSCSELASCFGLGLCCTLHMQVWRCLCLQQQLVDHLLDFQPSLPAAAL